MSVDVEGERDEVDIEDLFAEDFYIELVNRTGAAASEPFEVRGEGRIVRRNETATGLGLGRYLPARLLLEQRADPLDGVDEGTFERFETLFGKINHLLRSRQVSWNRGNRGTSWLGPPRVRGQRIVSGLRGEVAVAADNDRSGLDRKAGPSREFPSPPLGRRFRSHQCCSLEMDIRPPRGTSFQASGILL